MLWFPLRCIAEWIFYSMLIMEVKVTKSFLLIQFFSDAFFLLQISRVYFSLPDLNISIAGNVFEMYQRVNILYKTKNGGRIQIFTSVQISFKIIMIHIKII